MGNIFLLFLLGSCFITINLLFIIAAGLIRYMPQIMVAAARFAIGIVRLSIHAYNAAFQRLAPIIHASMGADISRGWGRVIALIALSLLLSLAAFFLVGQHFPWLIFSGGMAHGLMVSRLWDRVLYADHLRMGEEVK